MKRIETVLKEFAGKLSEENLDFLYARFKQKLTGDMPDCLEFISKFPEVDRWLSSAQSGEEFYQMVEQVSDYVEKEYNKRKKI